MKTIQSSKILCVAVLAFSALTACKSLGGGETARESNGSSAATGSRETVANADPKTALINSMKGLQERQSWVADVETSGDAASNALGKMQIKYAAPDSFQIENNAAGNKMQIVAVGGKTYMQMGGKWQQAPDSVNMGEMISNWKDMFNAEKMAAFKNIQAAGKETIDGRELAIYTYEVDQEKAMPEAMKKEMSDEAKAKIAEVQAENKGKIWVDEGQSLPMRMEMTMKMSKPQTLTQKVAVKYIYDQEVKIEAPKLK